MGYIRLLGCLCMALVVMAGSASAAPPAARNFVAPLSGGQEVPPVDTKATGLVKFQLTKDGSELDYKLIVANIELITQAHIHSGARGTNGAVVVFLFGFDSDGMTVNGILMEGTITDADLVGPLAGGTLADLLAEMRTGHTYVNVHTVANSSGEIRGQIATAGPNR